jgi:isopenicillin N synthase-like dioxygenase
MEPLDKLPIIDVSPLVNGAPRGAQGVAAQIEAACRQAGFFYITGHGVPPR